MKNIASEKMLRIVSEAKARAERAEHMTMSVQPKFKECQKEA